MKKPQVLSFAGFDPTGGAGILADIKTFSALEITGLGIITAITAQNFTKVNHIYSIPPSFIENQYALLKKDFSIRHAKVGMFFKKEIANIISTFIKTDGLEIVIDPVITSTSGFPLLEDESIDIMKKKIIPNSLLVTPNTSELDKLYNINGNFEVIKERISRLITTNEVKNLLLKGVKEDKKSGIGISDYLFTAENIYNFQKPDRGFDVHGSGCILSSAILAYLAKGFSLFDSVSKAEDYANYILPLSEEISPKNYLGNPFQLLYESNWKFKVKVELKELMNFIETEKKFIELIPEVRTNISVAIPMATDKSQIAGIDGRITVVNDFPKASGQIEFGKSKHTANLVLTAMKFFPSIRAVMNLRYKTKILNCCERAKLKIVEIRREEQPKDELKTMPWLVKKIAKESTKFPDIIFDKGEVGKEPMIRLFGSSALDLMKKVKLIIHNLE